MNHVPVRQDGEGVKVVVRGPRMGKAVRVLDAVVAAEADISGVNLGMYGLRAYGRSR